MSKPTESGTTTLRHAGQSGGLIDGAIRRRMLLVGTIVLGMLMLAATAVYACTTYWGQITIENISDGSGEFSVVADPTSGMDRCDDAVDGGDSGKTPTANNGKDSGEDSDTVRVEISKWEPNGQDSDATDAHPCEVGQRRRRQRGWR